jgi:antitoxin HigA-1
MPATYSGFGQKIETFSPRPAKPVTPGNVLRTEVRNRLKLTQAQLAEALGVSRHSVSEIENDRRSITTDMAVRLSRVADTSPEFWLNLQRDVDLYAVRYEQP